MTQTLKELIEASVNGSKLKVSQAIIERAPGEVDKMKNYARQNYGIELEMPQVSVIRGDLGDNGILAFQWGEEPEDMDDLMNKHYISFHVRAEISQYGFWVQREGEFN